MELRMPNINTISLTGRLTADPDYRTFPNGGGVLKFSVANNIPYKDKNGEFQNKVTFINISYFGSAADKYVSRLHKGSPVYVAGELCQDTWQDSDGKNRSTIYVRASKLQVLEKQSDIYNKNERIEGAERSVPPVEKPIKKTYEEENIDLDDLPF